MQLFRDQATILVILFNSSTYISGVALADYNRTGLKTLKKDIDMLNDICQQNGCEIISKIGIGYMIDVWDEELYIPFKNYVERKYHSFQLYRNAQSERVHYILRQILIGNGIYTQDLVEKCNYSESTIRRDLVEVKKRLERYNLSLINKTNKGMIAVGDEWDIRLALISEQFFYTHFEKVFFVGKEQIDDVFMNHNGFREIIYAKLRRALADHNYHVSYNSMMDLGDMILLSLQRRKFSKKLKEDIRFSYLNLEEEKKIILSIFNSIEGENENALNDKALNYLAVYLKGNRVLRFFEFEKLTISNKVEEIVDGFLVYLTNYFDIDKYDTEILRKDLCTGIAQMMIRTSFNVHIQPSVVSQFTQDGIMSLDYCSLLYRYLKENTTIQCNPNDVAKLYYSFSFFTKERYSKNIIKIMIVSKEGYFVSRATAYQFSSLISRNNIEFIPIEYMRIKDTDISDIVGFITDIDILKNEYPDFPVIDSHFLRKRVEVESAVNKIIYSSKIIKSNLISPKGIHYVKSFKDLKDVENYIREHVLLETDDKDLFFNEFYKRENVYSSRRNNIILINTIGDFLNRTFIEFIALEESMEYNNDFINKVIIFNIQGRETNYIGLIVRKLANLIHSHEFLFTGNREADFEMIESILFGVEG